MSRNTTLPAPERPPTSPSMPTIATLPAAVRNVTSNARGTKTVTSTLSSSQMRLRLRPIQPPLSLLSHDERIETSPRRSLISRSCKSQTCFAVTSRDTLARRTTSIRTTLPSPLRTSMLPRSSSSSSLPPDPTSNERRTVSVISRTSFLTLHTPTGSPVSEGDALATGAESRKKAASSSKVCVGFVMSNTDHVLEASTERSVRSYAHVPQKHGRSHIPLLLAALALLIGGCTTGYTPYQLESSLLTWTPVDTLDRPLPAGWAVYQGHSESPPLRAWLLRLPPGAHVEAHVSSDTLDRRSPTTDFAAMPGVCASVNAGYFSMSAVPSHAVGLVVTDGEVVAPSPNATNAGLPEESAARAAVGWDASGRATFGWAASSDGTLRLLASPTEASASAPLWNPTHAVSAGPMLVRDGRLRVTAMEEGFGTGSIPGVHPRTAIGQTADGGLLLLVVDGRQDISRGVSLSELGRILIEAGAVDAMNLDGGGSSTFVVGRDRLNLPTGYDVQREVLSALVAFCE